MVPLLFIHPAADALIHPVTGITAPDCAADHAVRPKDSEKIVKFNVELKDIQLQLEALSRQTGVDLKQLDHGTKFKRWFYSVKRTFANGWKKVTNFFKRYAEPITKVAIGIIPILFAIATKGSGSAPVPVAN